MEENRKTVITYFVLAVTALILFLLTVQGRAENADRFFQRRHAEKDFKGRERSCFDSKKEFFGKCSHWRIGPETANFE
ncbi:MAG: hypothetical protein JW884_01855 [Deltaproteobacteria bacterium]|nr:hypothetical protein [Deltaproteobacteria bacterium]